MTASPCPPRHRTDPGWNPTDGACTACMFLDAAADSTWQMEQSEQWRAGWSARRVGEARLALAFGATLAEVADAAGVSVSQAWRLTREDGGQ